MEPSTGLLSPSAFIPFCDLGGEASLVGRRVAGFGVPVCDKFEPRLVEGQICYSLDTDLYFKQFRRGREGREGRDYSNGKEGLTLLLDYNEERNIQEAEEPLEQQQEEESFVDGIVELQQRDKALIMLDTISQYTDFYQTKYFISLT